MDAATGFAIVGWLLAAAFAALLYFVDKQGGRLINEWKAGYQRRVTERDAALAKLAALKKLLDEGE